jgi:hypothetical protein
MKGRSKSLVFILGLFVAIIIFIGYQYSVRNGILSNRGIFGFQDTAERKAAKTKFNKTDYLKESLKKGSDQSLKNRNNIKKSNPFSLFHENTDSIEQKNETATKQLTKTIALSEQPIVNQKQELKEDDGEEQYFFSLKGEQKPSNNKFYSAVTRLTQTVKEGKLISFYLKEDIPLLGIKANTQLLGSVRIEFNRINIRITSIIKDKKVTPITAALICHDQDFIEGIFFENKSQSEPYDIKDEIIEDVLSGINSKPLNMGKKYIDRNKMTTEEIVIPKGKEVFLSIVVDTPYND